MKMHGGARYTKGEIGKMKVVRDFLPPPDKLVLRERTLGTTLGEAEVFGGAVWIAVILAIAGVIAWAVIRWLG